MAVLDLADIPSNINSYERLAVWAIQCLQSSANGEEVNVISGASSVPIAQCQVAVTADNPWTVTRSTAQLKKPGWPLRM